MAAAVAVLAFLSAPAGSAAAEPVEHFVQGELRGSLSWDSLSAMDRGVLKFGGAAGIYVLNGIELGFEQQFIVPSGPGPEGRSWAYLRAVPFRRWPLVPFVSLRAGYYLLPEKDAAAVGAGLGLVMFIDRHFAIEATLFTQAAFAPRGDTTRQTEFDTRLVLYY
jgi:hypothetical protein